MTQINDPFLRSIVGSPLNQVCFRLDGQIEEIAQRCFDVINTAEKEICILTDNCIPQLFNYHEKLLVNTLCDKADDMKTSQNEKPIKIIVRKQSAANDELGPFFFGVDKIDFREYQKDTLKNLNPSMQHDYFVIADDHIFWGKPGYNEGCFTYNAPLLVEKVKRKITDSFLKL